MIFEYLRSRKLYREIPRRRSNAAVGLELPGLEELPKAQMQGARRKLYREIPRRRSNAAVGLLGALLFLVGCSHHPVHEEITSVLPPLPAKQYVKLIEANTQGDEQYSGFYNNYIVKVTMLNRKVKVANLQRLGHYMQWDLDKARSEREKAFQEMASESDFFLSFFTPKRELDDLNSSGSIWKIYLDYNGTRYPGQVNKVSMKKAQLEALFPHHTGFNTPYEVTFRIPMSALEEGSSQLTITSSQGTSTFRF